ncbi:MAG: Hpt domain-containing protein [Proteobacteria bacterium]|nr:Hpt domain-containing protein [Pseudomonadota bacterium]
MTYDTDTSKGKTIVRIDKDLEDLIPGYLENRQKDIKSLLVSLGREDYESIRIIGHSMKGSGGGYGFDDISTLGKSIEEAAKDKNYEAIKRYAYELSIYLENIDIIYA